MHGWTPTILPEIPADPNQLAMVIGVAMTALAAALGALIARREARSVDPSQVLRDAD